MLPLREGEKEVVPIKGRGKEDAPVKGGGEAPFKEWGMLPSREGKKKRGWGGAGDKGVLKNA